MDLTPVSVLAQAPQTFSFQGRLTDIGGDPVPDASRNMTFRIYDVAVGGSELWSETKSVATSGGVYTTELGSMTSFDGFDFNRPLWLGVQVESDDELTPRSPLTSVPTSMGLVHPYKAVVDTTLPAFWIENGGSGDAILGFNRGSGSAGAFIVADPTGTSTNSGVFGLNDAQGPAIYGLNSGTGAEAGRFEVTNPGNSAPVVSISSAGTGPGLYSSDNAVFETADLSPTGSEGLNEDISIYASDAQIGMYSNEGGSAGSGFQLGEILGGILQNKWSIFRNTTGSSGALRFTWGSNPNYALNPIVASIDTTGQITAASFKYAQPKVGYYTVGTESFDAYDGWNSFDGYPFSGGPTSLREGVHLPQGARIKSVSCTVVDNSGAQDVTCTLYYREASLSGLFTVVSLSTGLTPGLTTLSDTLDHEVDNNQRSYFVLVYAPSWDTLSGDIKFRSYTIEYETDVTQ